MKDGLTRENGEQYFETSVKDALLPGGANGVKKFKGKLVSMKPALRPKELVLSMDEDKPQVTLKFETALPGKADPGIEIAFEGVAKAFQKDPFMLTFEVEDKDKITGWPVQAAAPAAKKGPAATKKAAPAKK